MRVVRRLLAPSVLGRIKSVLRLGNHYAGDYPDWEEAARNSTGYDAEAILNHVRQAVGLVRDGKAICERDGVLFDEPQYSFPVLAGLLRAAAKADGRLAVLDFGGSLGSSYFQCREFLSAIRSLSWSVVEQEGFVRCGREEFQNDTLQFHSTIQEAVVAIQPNVVLLSGVLQYLPEPYHVLEEIVQHRVSCLILDRHICSQTQADRIAVQHVPPSIYEASYPVRVFGAGAIERVLHEHYRVVAQFDCTWDGSHTEYCSGLAFESQGMILELRQAE